MKIQYNKDNIPNWINDLVAIENVDDHEKAQTLKQIEIDYIYFNKKKHHKKSDIFSAIDY